MTELPEADDIEDTVSGSYRQRKAWIEAPVRVRQTLPVTEVVQDARAEGIDGGFPGGVELVDSAVVTPPPPTATAAPARSPVRAIQGALLVTGLDALLLALGLGGPDALWRHSRAVALLIIWGIGAIVLAWLRPVRTHDPVEMRKDPPYAMPALFLLPLAVPPLSAWGERTHLWLIPGGLALRWAGVALSGLGFAMRIAAIATLGSRFSPFVAVQRDHTLETGGLYGRVRHPGYLGAWLVTLGAMLAFGSALTLPLVLLMLFLLDGRARREDTVLEGHFGDTFRHYRARTGRFFPRLLGAGRG
jgi:protein-S-isoprenylcysteine O-methyltransferase Ste14